MAGISAGFIPDRSVEELWDSPHGPAVSHVFGKLDLGILRDFHRLGELGTSLWHRRAAIASDRFCCSGGSHDPDRRFDDYRSIISRGRDFGDGSRGVGNPEASRVDSSVTAWPSLEVMFDLVSCIGRCGL